MATSKFRGLNVFIQDIRAAQNNADAERKRVDKEMANIRQKFTSGKGLDSYNRKKYVWKMIFMFMMGYEVDFGHMEIINCLTAQKYSEKHVGYVGISLLLKNTDEMMTLVINSIQQDLKEKERNEVQCLALAGIANIGGQMLTDAVGAMVVRMLIDQGTAPIVKKKAALTLLRLYRIDPTVIDIEDTAPRLALLLEDRNLGVVTCVASLILAMCMRERTGARRDALSAVVAPCVMRLTQLGLHRACSPDYLYYSTASPWIQVKLLQILQQFPATSDTALQTRLDEVLEHILSRTEVTKSVNKNNADHSVLFEACNLIIHHCTSRKDKNEKLRDQAVKLLARFISVREPNIRYLGLSSMTKLAKLGNVGHLIAEHQARILFTLKDGDISIRRRALDLVFAMCSSENAESLVDELLNYLVRAEPDIRAEMILKIAVLAERFQTNLRWYVDTILRIISTSGQHVSEEIWHRVVQIITNDEGLQPYAAAKVYEALQAAGQNATESLVSLAAYVVGEFGDLLVDAADGGVSIPIPPSKIFATLQSHFPNMSKKTQAIMLSTYVKMYHLFGEAVGADIAKLYRQMSTDLDIETQQRAVEYIQISKMKTASPNIVETVLDAMPPFKEGRQNALEDLLKKKSEKSKDQKKGEDGSGGSDNSDSDDNDSDGSDPSDDDGNGNSDSSGSDSESDSDSDENSTSGPSGGGKANALGDLLDLGAESSAAGTPDDGSAQLVFEKVSAERGQALGSSGGAVQGIPRRLMPAVLDSFRKSCTREKAVLCNDGNLQVGIQQKYQGFEGRVMIYLGNKGNAPLENFHAEIEVTNFLRWGPKTQRTITSPSIATGGSVSLNVRFHVMKPFVSPPQLRISYIVGNKECSYALRLPIVATRFVAPVAMPGPKFVGIFGQIPAAKQAQCVFEGGGTKLHIPQIKALVKSGLRMALCDATANQYVVCGAGSFKTGSKDKAGKPLSVGVLVKLECNPNNNKYRITVRAHHVDVAKAVQNILTNQLKGVDLAPGRGQAKAGPYDGGPSGL